jgi:hypothetical protein
MFYNNFEALRVKFMQLSQAQNWHETETEHESFGVYRHRWGDAIIRYLTPASLLAPTSEIAGYQHLGVAVD